MKNASKSKLFLCFRPAVEMDQLVLDNKEARHRRSCVSVKKQETKPCGSNSSQSDHCMASTESQNSPTLVSTKKSVSQVIRAVWLDAKLFNQIRYGKGVPQDYFKGSKTSSSTKSKESSDTFKDYSSTKVLNTYGRKWNSGFRYSSSSISPPRSSSVSEPSHQEQEAESRNQKKIQSQKDQKRLPITQKSVDNSGIYLLLVSLMVTIFCGKLCAILFTSIWLYSLPRQNIVDIICRPEYVWNLPEGREQCEENKKRVIMDGLLERNQKSRMRKRRTTMTI
ncbi:hypothetical protein K2173_018821 [Erythroxylum novogranatense]|uniref:Uncharacterized protein n=1 Tax=Erythroxylum novogranatense TaxID=1862640 RepID=A0AAV8SAV5_9ROSI|nr:hypothetical protein K2173_018821 [Erythroxylum novogranatense]